MRASNVAGHGTAELRMPFIRKRAVSIPVPADSAFEAGSEYPCSRSSAANGREVNNAGMGTHGVQSFPRPDLGVFQALHGNGFPGCVGTTEVDIQLMLPFLEISGLVAGVALVPPAD
jgi:hypothetical protein